MKNPLIRLREAVGMSRAEMAEVIGVTASSVQQYEAAIPKPHLKTLADFAGRKGLRDLQLEFLEMAGTAPPKNDVEGVDLNNLSAIESEIAATAVYIFRNQNSAYRQAVTKMLEYERTVLAHAQEDR